MRKEMTRKNMNTFVIAIRSRVTDRWLRVLVNKETGNAYLRYEDEVTNSDALWSVHEGHARKLRQKFEAGEDFDMNPPRTVIGGVILDPVDEPEQNPPVAAGVAFDQDAALVEPELEPWEDPDSESYINHQWTEEDSREYIANMNAYIEKEGRLGGKLNPIRSEDDVDPRFKEQKESASASPQGLADLSSAQPDAAIKQVQEEAPIDFPQDVQAAIAKTIQDIFQPETDIENKMILAAMSITGFDESAVYALELASQLPRYQHIAPHVLDLVKAHLEGQFKSGAVLVIDHRGTVTQYNADSLPIIGNFETRGRYAVRYMEDIEQIKGKLTQREFAISQLPIIGIMDQTLRNEAEMLVLISIAIPSRDAVINGMVTVMLPSGAQITLPIDEYKRMNPKVDMDTPDIQTILRTIRRFDELADSVDWLVMQLPEHMRSQRDVIKQHIGALISDMHLIAAVTPEQAVDSNPFAFMADIGTA